MYIYIHMYKCRHIVLVAISFKNRDQQCLQTGNFLISLISFLLQFVRMYANVYNDFMILCRLEGKIVIITGGASGIGAESVRLFTEQGARVVIVDVQDELGRNLAVSIGEDKASYYHCDVRNETEVENTVKFTVEKHGKLDVLFSNAGVIEPSVSILDLNLDELDRTVAVNLRGAAAFIKHAARAMVDKGTRGSIVCTTSVAAEISGTAPHG